MDNWPSILIMDNEVSLSKGLMVTGIMEAVTEVKESSRVLVVPPAPGTGLF